MGIRLHYTFRSLFLQSLYGSSWAITFYHRIWFHRYFLFEMLAVPLYAIITTDDMTVERTLVPPMPLIYCEYCTRPCGVFSVFCWRYIFSKSCGCRNCCFHYLYLLNLIYIASSIDLHSTLLNPYGTNERFEELCGPEEYADILPWYFLTLFCWYDLNQGKTPHKSVGFWQ